MLTQAAWDKIFLTGHEAAAQRAAVVKHYEHPPFATGPYPKGTPEEQAYSSGWESYMQNWIV